MAICINIQFDEIGEWIIFSSIKYCIMLANAIVISSDKLTFSSGMSLRKTRGYKVVFWEPNYINQTYEYFLNKLFGPTLTPILYDSSTKKASLSEKKN